MYVGGHLTVAAKQALTIQDFLSFYLYNTPPRLLLLECVVCVCTACCAINQPHFGLLGKHREGKKRKKNKLHLLHLFPPKSCKLPALKNLSSLAATGPNSCCLLPELEVKVWWASCTSVDVQVFHSNPVSCTKAAADALSLQTFKRICSSSAFHLLKARFLFIDFFGYFVSKKQRQI